MLARLRRGATPLAVLLTAGVSVLAIAGLARTVDPTAISGAADAARQDLPGLLIGVAAFASAFVVRARVWQLLHPGLSFGHALAAIHLALGGNHILPLRLGEPLRVLSVVRRAGVPAGDAVLTTSMMRAADMATLLLLGGISAVITARQQLTGAVSDLAASPAAISLTVVTTAVAMGTALVVRRRAGRGHPLVRPRPVVLLGTAAAWVLEAILVMTVMGWFGLDIGVTGAMFVLAAAVAAQLVAIAPGGLGTYEAAAVAGLVALDVPVGVAASAALSLHGVKTAWSLAVGWVALHHPAPPLWGRMRLAREATHSPAPGMSAAPSSTTSAAPSSTTPGGPVVLILPAHDEAPRIAEVIRRVPARVHGSPTRVVVVDDGSTDDTVEVALAAGAEVIRHDGNLGLGAAVRTGLQAAVEAGARAIAFCDADGEYDPAELDLMVGPILSDRADYVVGSRFDGQIHRMLPHRRLGNIVLTTWVRWTVRQPVTDGQSGYRALSPAAAAAAQITHDYNYAQVLTIDLLGRGFRYAEVPITYAFRSSGRSFIRLGRYLTQVIPAVWRQLNSRPAPSASTRQPLRQP